ncbi:MAG: response regulator [Chitinophagaceae bacterium]
MNNETFHILLVDDDEGDRLLFKDALEELEIKSSVHVMRNGMELMTYLNQTKSCLPDLIFLDLNMPRKSGLECLKEIRSNEELKDIYITIYSTSKNEKDIEIAFRNGANVYITKPDDFNTLKQVLKNAVMDAYQYGD